MSIKIKNPSLAESAYQHIILNINSGDWPAGFLLNRRDLANSLGMSPAPVLEAIVRLVAEGILETLPRKGTRVRLITPDELKGQLILREALECQAARMICGDKITKNFKSLQMLAKEIDKLGITGDSSINVYTKEADFHRKIVSLSECPPLIEAYERVMRISSFMKRRIILANIEEIRSSHSNLLNELSFDDPDRAKRAIRNHIHNPFSQLDHI